MIYVAPQLYEQDRRTVKLVRSLVLGIVFNLIRDIGSVTEVLTVLQDVPEEGRFNKNGVVAGAP